MLHMMLPRDLARMDARWLEEHSGRRVTEAGKYVMASWADEPARPFPVYGKVRATCFVVVGAGRVCGARSHMFVFGNGNQWC